MLKKMRRRFLAAAMGAISAVVLILVGILVVGAYSMVVSNQDETLDQILQIDRLEGPVLPIGGTAMERMPRDLQSNNQFAIVRFGESGELQSVGETDFLSLTQDEAEEYARAVLNGKHDRGYYKSYRYLRANTFSGTTVVLLDAYNSAQTLRALALLCLGVAAASLAAVFVLLLLFSNRAIAPYVRNIENQKRFITDASHELKTPLTAISTSADVLAMEQEGNEWVENIREQSARLAKLIGNLVTLSRLDEGQPFPEQGTFSLSDAVWEISESVAPVAQARGKQYSQQIEDGVELYGSREAVQQMVSILLDNAVKYSDEGGTIRLEVSRKQRKAVICVYNTCQGLDTGNLDRLFDRFYRPDESRTTASGGTGIGLAIAKATAEAQGGTIRAESTDGRSITFTVTL